MALTPEDRAALERLTDRDWRLWEAAHPEEAYLQQAALEAAETTYLDQEAQV